MSYTAPWSDDRCNCRRCEAQRKAQRAFYQRKKNDPAFKAKRRIINKRRPPVRIGRDLEL